MTLAEANIQETEAWERLRQARNEIENLRPSAHTANRTEPLPTTLEERNTRHKELTKITNAAEKAWKSAVYVLANHPDFTG